MPTYKLIYFNAKGAAELTRLLFAQAGVSYEDCRLEGPEWQKLKPTMPTGTLPVLEIDGKKFPQSQTIARYVAREYGLAGSNNLEQAQGEAAMDTMVDLRLDLRPLFTEKDEAKKSALKKAILEEKVNPKLKHIENMLIANGEVFAGNKIAMADLAFFTLSEFLVLLSDDPLKDFPKLAALKERVSKEPKIAAWLEKRPVTAF